jgi:hypothetical protein
MKPELLQRWLIVGVVLMAPACAGRSNTSDVAFVQDPRCAAVGDSISKYVSEDALPTAQLVGDDALPRPAGGHPGDSVAVDFVVFPNGVADTSSVEVLGSSDVQFVRNAVRFAARHRFAPAQISGCNVISRYSVVMRSGGQP